MYVFSFCGWNCLKIVSKPTMKPGPSHLMALSDSLCMSELACALKYKDSNERIVKSANRSGSYSSCLLRQYTFFIGLTKPVSSTASVMFLSMSFKYF